MDGTVLSLGSVAGVRHKRYGRMIPESIAHDEPRPAAVRDQHARPESTGSRRDDVQDANVPGVDNVADRQPLGASPIPPIKHDASGREFEMDGRSRMTGRERTTIRMLDLCSRTCVCAQHARTDQDDQD